MNAEQAREKARTQQPVLSESDKKTLDKVYEIVDRAIEANPRKGQATISFYLNEEVLYHLIYVDKYYIKVVPVPPSNDPREHDYYIISW